MRPSSLHLPIVLAAHDQPGVVVTAELCQDKGAVYADALLRQSCSVLALHISPPFRPAEAGYLVNNPGVLNLMLGSKSFSVAART